MKPPKRLILSLIERMRTRRVNISIKKKSRLITSGGTSKISFGVKGTIKAGIARTPRVLKRFDQKITSENINIMSALFAGACSVW